MVLTAPDANGSPITGYSVTCYSTDGGVTNTQTGATTTIKVSGLDGGKNYRCRARATNAAGTGTNSVYGDTVLLPAATAPGRPTVASSTPSAGAVTVVLTAPDANGSPITGYSVTCYGTDGGVTNAQTGATTTIKVSGLDGGKNYRCRARATNAAGTGTNSVYGDTVLLPAATAPGRPTVVSSTPSAGAVTVVLTPPDANGSPITGYSVTCYGTDGGVTRPQTGATTTIKVSGLDGGKNYRCRARATNAAGTGTNSVYGATVLVP